MLNYQDKFFVLIVAVLLAYLTYLLAPILTPFLAGALIAYLANPLVNLLVRLHIPRAISVTIVFLLFFIVFTLLILLLIPLIGRQINTFIEIIPTTIAWLQSTILPLLKEFFGLDESVINVNALKDLLIQNSAKAKGIVDWIFLTALHSGFKIFQSFMTLLLIPVVTFYLLYDWNKFIIGLRSLLPRKIEPTVVKLFSECDEVLSAFFRGQFIVMLALAIIYSTGLSIIGLQVGLLIGLIAGLLSIVPYLGSIVGIIIASVAAFIQFNSFNSVLLVWLIFGVGHLIDGFFLTPTLLGNRIGLHPVAVIFAILAGGELFGFVGVLLALPVAASIMVWLRYLYLQYHKSKLYKA